MPSKSGYRASLRLSRLVAGAVAALLVAVACSGDPRPVPRTTHGDGEGPLGASIGVGGNALEAPAGAGATWRGTFGGFVLCTTTPGVDVVVQRLRYENAVAPKDVEPWVRTIRPGELRTLSPRRRSAYLPTYAALGSPPDFNEPYIDTAVPGRYRPGVRGWRVRLPCTRERALEQQLGRGEVPDEPLQELMLAVTTPRSGARISRLDIDYLADGRPMTLRLDWQMVTCGPAIRDPDAC